jgi:hypothetical protein
MAFCSCMSGNKHICRLLNIHVLLFDPLVSAYFPGSIETHSIVENLYFGDNLMLRRHDYNVNIAGGFGAAQLTSNYIHANGIRLPSKLLAYTRGRDNRPILDMLMVFIDISNVSFT